jgi:hypothetical protein
VPLGLANVVNRLRRAYWPVGVFLTGSGRKRYEEMTSRRNTWFPAIWLPLVLAIGVPLMFARC